MSDEDTKSSIYAGGLPYELTEGDIVCVFSQYGEIFEISLSRDRETGKSRGFCFIKYEDSRSCELAVDNLHGATIVGRKIKVSYANNTNAIKATRPTIVAPQVSNILKYEDSKDIHERERLPIKEKHSSLSPHRRSYHHKSSRVKDESLSPRPKSRHESSRLKRKYSPSRSKSHHKSSRHKREKSPSHSRSHHHKSKNRDADSPSNSRRHRSKHESSSRSSKSSKRRL